MSMELLSQRLTDHMSQDERDFASMKDMHNEIKNTLHKLETNHLFHVEKDMAEVHKILAGMSVKVENLDWLYKLVVGAIVLEVIALGFLAIKNFS